MYNRDIVYIFNLYEGKQIIKAVMSSFVVNDFDPGTQMGQLGMGDLQNPLRQRGY